MVRMVLPNAEGNSERLLEAKAQQLDTLAAPLLQRATDLRAQRRALQREEADALVQLLEVGYTTTFTSVRGYLRTDMKKTREILE